jgi:hypothetical protein
MTKEYFLRALAAKIQDLRETDIAQFIGNDEGWDRDADLVMIEDWLFRAQTLAEEKSADD